MLIGNTILIGILRTPGEVAARLPSPALFIGVWVIGGLFALLGAISLAEPGAMLARSGGQYVIVRRGLGEYPAFVVGWSDWISTCGPVALGGMVFTEYLEPLMPALAGRRVPAGVALVLLFGLLLWRGIRIGDLSQQILSAAKALAFGSLIAVCLLVPVPAETAARPGPGPARLSGVALVTAIVLALQAVIYTYDGWTGPLYFGEETRNPGRGIPRSMVLGVLLVILIYVLVNVAFVRVLGMSRMAGDPFVAASAGKALFGEPGRPGDPAAGADFHPERHERLRADGTQDPAGHEPRPAAPRRPRDGEPGRHPERGALDQHRGRGGVHRHGDRQFGARAVRLFFVANYTLSFLSVFALRRNEPETPRPWRVPGFRSPPDWRCWAPWRFSPGRWSAIGATAGSRCCCWRSAIRCIGLLSPVRRYPVPGSVRRKAVVLSAIGCHPERMRGIRWANVGKGISKGVTREIAFAGSGGYPLGHSANSQ